MHNQSNNNQKSIDYFKQAKFRTYSILDKKKKKSQTHNHPPTYTINGIHYQFRPVDDI